ncbi:MAG: hypothetical protein DYG92_02485 [Leptolyngbya sp. PLA1]|nr:hypothetical protein [Leptolyngbya sp. PLA1]
MATYISDSSDEFGRSVAQSKLESKVRADFELTGFVRDWILIVRPFQKIIAEHSDIMVQQGVMTREEAVHWLNMHWELICSEPKRVAAGCAIAAYGRERQTRAVVHVKQESFVGYSRIRLKAETFVLPRSGAGEGEVDLDELTVAGVSQRRAGAASEPVNPEMSGEAPSGGLDLEEFPFAGIEVQEDEGSGRANREWGVGEVWAKVDFDDDYYEAILEFWGVLKEEKHAEHLEMAEEAADLLGGEHPDGEDGAGSDDEHYPEVAPGEPFGMAGVYRVREKKQGIHQPGSKNFMKGRSVLEHPNPQALLDRWAGTGMPKQVHKNGFVQREVIDCRKVIGMYYEQGSNLPKPTTRFMIHYSPKNNQAHIVPARPRSDDEDDE